MASETRRLPVPRTGKRHRMYCRLVEWSKGDGDDFVPAGTPVEVFGWSVEEHGMLECRALVHVYCAPHLCEEMHGQDWPAVGRGLWIRVPPWKLTYERHRTDRVGE